MSPCYAVRTVKPLFVVFAPAPALFGFAVGYVVRQPEAKVRLDVAVGAAVFALLWALPVLLGMRWRRRAAEPLQTAVLALLIGSAALGALVLILEVAGALG